MASWDVVKLQTMSVHDRHQLWLNAKAKLETNMDAKTLVRLIESSGLDYGKDKRKPVSLDDPICRAMARIIASDAGMKAALEATEQGLPALAGVDSLLRKLLGNDYSKDNEATVQAGYLMTGFMEGHGYEKVGQRPMPGGCVAKTGLIFRRRKNHDQQND